MTKFTFGILISRHTVSDQKSKPNALKNCCLVVEWGSVGHLTGKHCQGCILHCHNEEPFLRDVFVMQKA